MLTSDGSLKDTWWLVDNGFVGADGIARTASPPYSGLDAAGEYVVCKRLPGVIGSSFDLGIGSGGWLDFGSFCLGGGLSGISIASEMIGILAASASSLSAGSYHFGVPQFADIVLPEIAPDGRYHLNIDEVLPQAATPWGNVVLPQITGIQVEPSTAALKFTIANSNRVDLPARSSCVPCSPMAPTPMSRQLTERPPGRSLSIQQNSPMWRPAVDASIWLWAVCSGNLCD